MCLCEREKKGLRVAQLANKPQLTADGPGLKKQKWDTKPTGAEDPKAASEYRKLSLILNSEAGTGKLQWLTHKKLIRKE